MKVLSYQSKLVADTLRAGQIYRAKPNLRLKGEYDALIDMLDLHCECPVFGVLQGRRQNTGGKVSGAWLLTLEVPAEELRLTEYGVWADFLYLFKYTMPGNYRSLRPDCEEITTRDYQAMLNDLRDQRPPSAYKTPQVVMERIDPKWVLRMRRAGASGLLGRLFGR